MTDRLIYDPQINKSPGQTFKRIGIYLPRPVFMHGQQYVGQSRVGERKGLTLMVTHDRLPDCPKDNHTYTTNMVYSEVPREVFVHK